MKTLPDISYGPLPTQLIDLYLPEGDEFDLYIHFHGGGLESGSRRVFDPFPLFLTRRGVALASVEYRMFPDAAYPDFLEDAALAVAYIKNTVKGIKRLFVGGASAGGYISMMLCFDKRWLSAVGVSPTDIAGFFHDAGQPTKHFNLLKYSGLDSRRVIVDDTAPLYHIGAEAYPPMRFTVSDKDLPGRLEQTRLVIATLRHFGISEDKISLDIRGGHHCHYCEAMLDGQSLYGQMIMDFIDWIKRQ